MDNAATKQLLQEARDFLASGHWTTSIGNEVMPGWGPFIETTCAIGAVAKFAHPRKQHPGTSTHAIHTLVKYDGEAVKALFAALPEEFKSDAETQMKAQRERPMPDYDDSEVAIMSRAIFPFNDHSLSSERVVALFDTAIASLD